MPKAKSTRTTLGPGQEILDQNLLKKILITTALTPITLLRVASFYKFGPNNDLANQLVLIALALKTARKAPSPTSPSTGQAPASAATMASPVVPMDEWADQIEDFFWGYIDNEDKAERSHPPISTTENIYWFPLSDSLPNIGLMIEEISLNIGSLKKRQYYIIGLCPDPNSLPD